MRGKVGAIKSYSFAVRLGVSCQAFLDYAHIVTRLPELEEELGQEQELDIVSSLEEETDELARNASKLIGILPDALRDRSDSRHNAALAYMIRVLVKMVDKYRPFTLVRPEQSWSGDR